MTRTGRTGSESKRNNQTCGRGEEHAENECAVDVGSGAGTPVRAGQFVQPVQGAGGAARKCAHAGRRSGDPDRETPATRREPDGPDECESVGRGAQGQPAGNPLFVLPPSRPGAVEGGPSASGGNVPGDPEGQNGFDLPAPGCKILPGNGRGPRRASGSAVRHETHRCGAGAVGQSGTGRVAARGGGQPDAETGRQTLVCGPGPC